jgi:SAM-dependent methyltransferase
MSYWDSFGYEWLHFPTVQLDGPGRDESERTFRLKTGLTPEDVKGKRVLDVGCGMGRFLEVVSRWGAKVAAGFDPSSAIRSSVKNLEGRRTVYLRKSSIESFRLGRNAGEGWGRKFDLVYCIGVLHHTPDPRASFLKIARLVKPGGRLCVWVYSQDEGRPWMRIAYAYRTLTTRLPWWLLYGICTLAIPWHYVRCIPLVGRYLWPLFPCSGHPHWQWRHLDTFDLYSPQYRSQHSETEVKAWFIDAGFVEVEALSFPVSVRGRKPA